MNIPFWKMSGSGNDFIVMDHRKPLIPAACLSAFVVAVCRRGLSVGADGVILIESSSSADYAWRFFNADGGEASMCGNGSRCVARFAHLQGIAPAQHRFETRVGTVSAQVLAGGRVRVRLPDPSDLRMNVAVEISGKSYEGHFINTGVPHFVYLVDDVDAVEVVGLGQATRHHPHFAPQGTNANFVQVLDARTLKIRTYERGVEDETLACGTGSIAAAILGAMLGKVTPPVQIQTRSGILLGVDFVRTGGAVTDIFLEGDARIIYKGEMQEEAWQ
jgi:diaminopimelate epimerase